MRNLPLMMPRIDFKQNPQLTCLKNLRKPTEYCIPFRQHVNVNQLDLSANYNEEIFMNEKEEKFENKMDSLLYGTSS